MATYRAVTHHLGRAISCHALSGPGNLLAICPNGCDVILLERSNGTWKVLCRLEGHDQIVSGLDFHEDSQGSLKLVSSSHDRNSYVWTRHPGPHGSSSSSNSSGGSSSWSPELVITKLPRAGLCVRWSPCGRKFAIGSGEKSVCLCYYDSSRELWAPKLIKKQHGSSVTAVAWHPSGAVLATGSTDRTCRVFNAVIPDVDGACSAAALGASRFGELLLAVASRAWVLAVAWSPSGDTLAFCSQDSTVTLLPAVDLLDAGSLSSAEGRRQQLQLPGLPLKCLAFLADSVLVGAGFDFQPLLFRRQEGSGVWQLVRLDLGSQEGSSSAPVTSGSSLSARIKMFEAQMAKPQAGSSKVAHEGSSGKAPSSSSEQPHSNCIVCITPVRSDSGTSLQFLTSGLDGKVVEWQLDGCKPEHA